MEVIYRETRFIAKGVAVCSILFLAGSVVFDFFSIPLLIGALLGGLYAIAHFVLIGHSVLESQQRTPEKARSYMSRQYFMRMFLTALVIFLSIEVDFISPLGLIPALFYPKISIYARSIYQYAVRNRH